jgi:hypothetical protein
VENRRLLRGAKNRQPTHVSWDILVYESGSVFEFPHAATQGLENE